MTIAKQLQALADKIEASKDHSIDNSVLLETLELTQFSKSTSAPFLKRIVSAYRRKWGNDPGVLDIHMQSPDIVSHVTWAVFELFSHDQAFLGQFKAVVSGAYTFATPDRLVERVIEERLKSLSGLESVLAKTAKQYIDYKKLSDMLMEKIAPLRVSVSGE